MYICIDPDGYSAKGETLNEALCLYEESITNYSSSDVEFFKCEKVDVEIMEKKQTVVIEKKVSK